MTYILLTLLTAYPAADPDLAAKAALALALAQAPVPLQARAVEKSYTCDCDATGECSCTFLSRCNCGEGCACARCPGRIRAKSSTYHYETRCGPNGCVRVKVRGPAKLNRSRGRSAGGCSGGSCGSGGADQRGLFGRFRR